VVVLQTLLKPSQVPAIELEGVSKTFQTDKRGQLLPRLVSKLRGERPTQTLPQMQLKSINLRIEVGESVALVGNNGAGKSSLLRIIAGIYQPSSGRVTVCGRLSPVLQLGAGFNPNLSGFENIFINAAILGISRPETADLLPGIIEFSELEEHIHKPVKFYSTGMQARLAFSVAVASFPDILLLDEILAVGDQDFQNKCRQRITEIQDSGATLIYVSHDLESVVDLCPRAVWLSQGTIVAEGDTATVIEAYRS
jgi:teichoic acid transport system ATP-binding protein